jgi:hypothetical protein
MSDTPKTNAAKFWSDIGGWVTPASKFMELEQELNAANSIIRQQQLLDEENLRLQERIKELEAMLRCWLLKKSQKHKTKEAKL